MPVSVSIIWKFTSLTCWQTICNQYFAMERRYSGDNAFNPVTDELVTKPAAQAAINTVFPVFYPALNGPAAYPTSCKNIVNNLLQASVIRKVVVSLNSSPPP